MSEKSIKTHHVIFVGDSSVGKTSIISRYITGTCPDSHSSTIGVDFFAKNVNEELTLKIWDTAGQEKFRALVPAYIRPSTVAVLVYDVTSKQSFESIQLWAQMIREVANPELILVANKIDIEEEKISSEEGQNLAKDLNAKFIETSATLPKNINELFEIISEIPVIEKEEMDIPKLIINIAENEKVEEKNCSC